MSISWSSFFLSWTSTYQDRLTMAPLPQYLKHWDEELVQLFEQWWMSLSSSYNAVILLCNKMTSFAWTFEMPSTFLLLFCHHQSALVQCEDYHLFSIDQWIICQMPTLYRPISMCLSHQCRCFVSSSSFVEFVHLRSPPPVFDHFLQSYMTIKIMMKEENSFFLCRTQFEESSDCSVATRRNRL